MTTIAFKLSYLRAHYKLRLLLMLSLMNCGEDTKFYAGFALEITISSREKNIVEETKEKIINS